jgi:hypothetical protein
MAILQKVTKYEPVQVDQGQLMTIAEAAIMLGITGAGVRSAMDRGELHEYIDDERTWQGRRLVMRAEVEKLAENRVDAILRQ